MGRFFFTKKIVFVLFFFLLYTGFWVIFFHQNKDFSGVVSPIARAKGFLQNIFPQSRVLGESLSFFKESAITESLPLSYNLSVLPRKQVFNLSCEFAAAATILFHYTSNNEFSPANEEQAEKILVEQVGVSNNPNIGIRMGENVPSSSSQLYSNLNKSFGGEDYYGVHAPPFIDIFAQYQLLAKPIYQTKDVLNALKKAIYSGHLIMAWIKLGVNSPVDVALSYGSVPVVRGEHVVVIYGYDNSGVFVMDPGAGIKRHISYHDLLSASSSFVMPFLEVYPANSGQIGSYEPTFLIDKATGLNRHAIKISVLNLSGEHGAATILGQVLHDFGYVVFGIDDGEKSEEEGLLLQIKKEKADYLKLLERDLSLASYNVSSVSSDLIGSSSADVILTIRQDSLGN